AVVGGVVQELRARIRPLDGDKIFRLHLPDGIHDFHTLEKAVEYAEKIMPKEGHERSTKEEPFCFFLEKLCVLGV
ncbi:MAG: hypothetical protein B5M51_03120, partial [Anaerolinea sp. 4484_236]